MRNLFIILIVCLLASCGVPQSKYDELEAKYDELASQMSKLQSPDSTVKFGGRDLYLVASRARLRQYRAGLGNSSQIDSTTAANKLFNYKLWRDLADDGLENQSRDWQGEVYGNLFTWREFRAFVRYVHDLRQSTNPDIDGVRIYAGATFYEDGFIPDVFFMPTIDGKNLIDIDPDFPKIDSLFRSEEEIVQFLKDQKVVTSSDPIFNVSKPCPYECD